MTGPASRSASRSGARGALHWTVNGNAVPLDASGTAFVPVRLGTFVVEARDGVADDRVVYRVVAPARNDMPGFTLRLPARYSNPPEFCTPFPPPRESAICSFSEVVPSCNFFEIKTEISLK